jgi:hypothetical protein
MSRSISSRSFQAAAAYQAQSVPSSRNDADMASRARRLLDARGVLAPGPAVERL